MAFWPHSSHHYNLLGHLCGIREEAFTAQITEISPDYSSTTTQTMARAAITSFLHEKKGLVYLRVRHSCHQRLLGTWHKRSSSGQDVEDGLVALLKKDKTEAVGVTEKCRHDGKSLHGLQIRPSYQNSGDAYTLLSLVTNALGKGTCPSLVHLTIPLPQDKDGIIYLARSFHMRMQNGGCCSILTLELESDGDDVWYDLASLLCSGAFEGLQVLKLRRVNISLTGTSLYPRWLHHLQELVVVGGALSPRVPFMLFQPQVGG